MKATKNGLRSCLRDGTLNVRTYPSTDGFPTLFGIRLIRSVVPDWEYSEVETAQG